jgi:hypothetical protein
MTTFHVGEWLYMQNHSHILGRARMRCVDFRFGEGTVASTVEASYTPPSPSGSPESVDPRLHARWIRVSATRAEKSSAKRLRTVSLVPV